ncbi:2-(3-amino-3-carboxypropyl)histidine synthase [uncultured archaeon]|nr:2-(3-amino-3-carboxypropyl)histidine synthase [uncultured archaeon]
MSEYDLELDRVISEIKGASAKRVGLQFPEGLKQKAVEVARKIEDETGATTIVFLDPTYGACDLKTMQAEKLGLDLLFHFGHLPFERVW